MDGLSLILFLRCIRLLRGIAWAPACGLAMAELVLNGASKTLDLTPFDPTRFSKQKTNQRGRKKQGVNVGEQW
jgi:hypothetical protein